MPPKQASKADLESSADYVTVATGDLPVSVVDIGFNAARKSPHDKRLPRAIFYKGACTVTKPGAGEDSVDLIPTTDYTYLPIQYAAIESAANDVFVLF